MGEIMKQKQEVVQVCEVAPAAGSAVDLPLTFFDLHWSGPGRVKRIFFYHFPHSTSHFIETTLAKLKHSLSLTLQNFFPLAGNLCCPPSPQKPFIRFNPNIDTVPLTIFQHSPSSDFNLFLSNHPHHIQQLEDHLVAELPLFPKPCNEEEVLFPILSVKITLFPGEGLCIGTTYRHVVDGKSFSHFITSWASLCLNNNQLPSLQNSLPFLQREVVQDTKGLEAVFLEKYFKKLALWKHLLKAPPISFGGEDEHIVRITLELNAADVKNLKKWVSIRCKPPPMNLSRLTATCALLWVSLVRSTRGSLEENEEQEEWLLLQADCRNRIGNIPWNYFGNCLTPVGGALKHKDFVGEESSVVVAAVKVIDEAISRMKTDPLSDTEKLMTVMNELAITGRGVRLTTVAGSPNLAAYKTDFGFGSPTKVDLVNMVNNFFFAESGKNDGGFEIGISLNKDHVDHFLSVFEQGFKSIGQVH